MRFRHSLMVSVLLLTGLAAYAQQVPRPAGEFAIKMPNGQITLLSQYAGKVVVLAFISTTCSHCQHTTQVDRKSTRLNSSHLGISYAVFCLKKTSTLVTAPSSTL